MQNNGASPDGDRATHERSRVSPSPPTVGIPSAERQQIVAFLTWWAEDQGRQADTANDLDKEIEFSIRAAALADAARDILHFGDVRHAASGTPTRRAETLGSVGEADGGPTLEEGDAQGAPHD